MTIKEQYWKYSLVAIIVILGITLFIEFIPFFTGILGASTIYILERRQLVYLTEKRGMRRGFAASLLLIEAILCFLIPISVIVWMLINKIQNFNLDPQTILAPINQMAGLLESKTGYNLLDKSNVQSVISSLPEIGQALMGSIGHFIINIIVLIFVLYFMLIGGKKMESFCYDILPFNTKNKKEVLEEINMIVKSNAIGIPLLAVIQGGVALIGYLIFDVPSALFFGLLTCFATVIPIVGCAIIWFPLALYVGLTGNWGGAIGLIIYSTVITTNIDNPIRFLLQKKIADIHPLITIFGVVIGLSLFGFMGVIFGPLLLSIFILCVNMFKEEYLK